MSNTARIGGPAALGPNMRKKRTLLSCFNIIIGLVILQACILLTLGFFSENLSFDQSTWQSSLDYIDFFNDDIFNDDARQIEDSFFEKAEESLNKWKEEGERDLIDTQEGGKKAIDTYYSSQHIRQDKIGRKIPLVVGGSDGSGTRAFVDVLGRLGVPMLVDDSGTMDVHGKAILKGRGWPPLASAVLRESRSSNYNFDDLSDGLQNLTVVELSKLRDGFQKRGDKLLEKALSSNVSYISRDISYGFKAPVTMLLVPILQKVLGPMKFLHIVRDGRDVAMSQNQSPVKKFFNDSYVDAPDRRKNYSGDLSPVLAMQLWSDWNTGLFDYERKHLDEKSFDFLVMRTEDLMNPEKKFKSLVQLADFVGSQKTLEELCCMSRKTIVDMGKSAGVGDGRFPKARRYGDLYNHLHRDNFKPGTRLSDKIANVVKLRQSAGATPIDLGSAQGKRKSVWMDERAERMHERIVDAQEERQKRFENLSNRIAERESARRNVELKSVVEGVDPSVRNLRAVPDLEKVNPESKGSVGRRRLQESLLLEQLPGQRNHRMGMDSVQRSEQFHRLLERLKADLRTARKAGDSEKVENLSIRIQLVLQHANVEEKTGLALGRQAVLRTSKPKDISNRYGKWVEMLKDKPEISRKLHEEGAKGLLAFGYDPEQGFQDPGPELDFSCDNTVQCT